MQLETRFWSQLTTTLPAAGEQDSPPKNPAGRSLHGSSLMSSPLSGFKGSCWNPHAYKYDFYIVVQGTRVSLGSFPPDSAHIGAQSYDTALLALYGPTADTNYRSHDYTPTDIAGAAQLLQNAGINVHQAALAARGGNGPSWQQQWQQQRQQGVSTGPRQYSQYSQYSLPAPPTPYYYAPLPQATHLYHAPPNATATTPGHALPPPKPKRAASTERILGGSQQDCKRSR
jgi:hypothetical protein